MEVLSIISHPFIASGFVLAGVFFFAKRLLHPVKTGQFTFRTEPVSVPLTLFLLIIVMLAGDALTLTVIAMTEAVIGDYDSRVIGDIARNWEYIIPTLAGMTFSCVLVKICLLQMQRINERNR